jgi:5-enolpyruvylshikimate-3-phosphate synthase
LEENSQQGDRAILRHLQEIKAGTPTISAKDIPDLVPILAVVAAANRGAVIKDIQRLRL